jgi:cytochrome P450
MLMSAIWGGPMTEATEEIQALGDEFIADPHRVYRDLRERGRVHHVILPGGVPGWVITGYAECRAALADSRLHKGSAGAQELLAKHGQAFSAGGAGLVANMLNSDPPDHTRLRRLVNKAFTSGAVEALRPRIEQIADDLLDAMAAEDEVDLMTAFAVPLPLTVIFEVLGVPPTDRDDFRSWTDTLFGAGGDRAAAAKAMGKYLTELVQAKRGQQADDLLSALVRAVDDGDQLTGQELVAMAFLLLVAGHETTVNLIGNGVLALLLNPGQFDALKADPARVPAAVEEFLRYDSPVNIATTRYTREPVVIAGTEIPAGEFVHVALPAANRDPERFADPDTLDIARETAGHVGFGHGIHYCVGAPLARMEATIAFTRLLSRFPQLRVAAPQPLGWRDTSRIHGLISLPVRLR